MIGVALLVFREVLEASLIISVVCAATRGVAHRGWYVSGGIALGAAGAVLVALGAGFISGLVGGAGQEVFNAAVLLIAVAMIGWHVVWMSRHSREMVQEMNAVGGAVRTGSSSLTMLLAVVALAVLREGSEIVLFLYGMLASGTGMHGLIGGTAIGIAGGAALGFALYAGLLRIPLRHLFGFTNGMLALLAAGLASDAARFLVQGNLLPAWGTQIWNLSWLLPNGSMLGRVLSVLVGYDASPSGIQIVFYLVTLTLLVTGMRWSARALLPRPTPTS
ncbi:FTR1 family protein [Oleiagrimonas sp. MCCC 1A03011]|uniref:FTR1 family iron permease n=1 Tax=Oleiagrimonas sp. MCCC 1A03011 TaxID=1926883 RepID=UPI000DC31B25|nr:FTR1 family protein [Oleiagrimonas sp. MCCC 1A03011]RAP56104.1 iron permease [Oleiagrimonas sp. MCCC 1A03011]